MKSSVARPEEEQADLLCSFTGKRTVGLKGSTFYNGQNREMPSEEGAGEPWQQGHERQKP